MSDSNFTVSENFKYYTTYYMKDNTTLGYSINELVDHAELLLTPKKDESNKKKLIREELYSEISSFFKAVRRAVKGDDQLVAFDIMMNIAPGKSKYNLYESNMRHVVSQLKYTLEKILYVLTRSIQKDICGPIIENFQEMLDTITAVSVDDAIARANAPKSAVAKLMHRQSDIVATSTSENEPVVEQQMPVVESQIPVVEQQMPVVEQEYIDNSSTYAASEDNYSEASSFEDLCTPDNGMVTIAFLKTAMGMLPIIQQPLTAEASSNTDLCTPENGMVLIGMLKTHLGMFPIIQHISMLQCNGY